MFYNDKVISLSINSPWLKIISKSITGNGNYRGAIKLLYTAYELISIYTAYVLTRVYTTNTVVSTYSLVPTTPPPPYSGLNETSLKVALAA